MSATPILGITEVAENQNSKHITINDAFGFLESASNSRIAVDMNNDDLTMTESMFTSSLIFFLTNASGPHNLVVPSTVNGMASDRFVVFQNTTAQDITIEAGSAATNTISIAPSSVSFIHVGGSTITVLFSQNAVVSAGDEVAMALFISDQPGVGAEVLRHVLPRSVVFAGNFASSRGSVGINPTGSAIWGIARNGSSVGTITISTGGVFTYASTGGLAQTFLAGDILTITAPSPQDATLADIGITLFGTKI